MSGILAKLLRDKVVAGNDLALSGDQLETLLAQAEAATAQNAGYARQLAAQIGGNHKLVMNERPDGSGFFYGNFYDEGGTTYRVDVMPPKHIWSGDCGIDAADDMHWIVYLNGDEVQRAKTIAGLVVLTVGDA